MTDLVEEIRLRSSRLFGTRHRLEVAACIATLKKEEAARFHPRKVTHLLHGKGFPTPEHKVGAHLKALVECKVLERLPTNDSSTMTADYRRLPSALWELAPKLLEEIRRGEDGVAKPPA